MTRISMVGIAYKSTGAALPGYEVELWFGVMAPRGTPQRFGERIRKDYDRWVKVVREQNIKPE